MRIERYYVHNINESESPLLSILLNHLHNPIGKVILNSNEFSRAYKEAQGFVGNKLTSNNKVIEFGLEGCEITFALDRDL